MTFEGPLLDLCPLCPGVRLDKLYWRRAGLKHWEKLAEEAWGSNLPSLKLHQPTVLQNPCWGCCKHQPKSDGCSDTGSEPGWMLKHPISSNFQLSSAAMAAMAGRSEVQLHRHVMRGRTRDGQAAAVSNEEWSFDTFDPCCNKFFKSKRLGGPGSWVKLAKSCLKGCEKLWMNCALYLTTSVFQECWYGRPADVVFKSLEYVYERHIHATQHNA